MARKKMMLMKKKMLWMPRKMLLMTWKMLLMTWKILLLTLLSREERGPLHGVPVSIKECYDVAGTYSTAGMAFLARYSILCYVLILILPPV